MLQMQSDFDTEKAALNAKINELTVATERLQKHNDEKDCTINQLNLSIPQVSVLITLRNLRIQFSVQIITRLQQSFKNYFFLLFLQKI